MKLEFSWQIFEKKTQVSNFMKIRPLGAQLFHVGGRTDGGTGRPDDDASRSS
jgi:hypothetical protein